MGRGNWFLTLQQPFPLSLRCCCCPLTLYRFILFLLNEQGEKRLRRVLLYSSPSSLSATAKCRVSPCGRQTRNMVPLRYTICRQMMIQYCV